MAGRRGSALVLAMLLLVLLSAAGIFVMSRIPALPGDGPIPYHRAAVARNMARSGVHAAVARLSGTRPDDAPFDRLLPVEENLSGQYSVTIRKMAREGDGIGRRADGTFERYEIVSEGSVTGFPGEVIHVRAVVQVGPIPSPAPRATILTWEEHSRGGKTKKGIDGRSVSRI